MGVKGKGWFSSLAVCLMGGEHFESRDGALREYYSEPNPSLAPGR